MKKCLFLFGLFVIGGGLVSCTRTDVNKKLLKQVESCVEVYPDSAMRLINLIEYPEHLHGKERADYALLMAQTLDKNYLDSLQSDSLIKIAVDYYKSNNDFLKAGRAYYYYGKVMVAEDKLSEAMQAYLEALDLLKKTNEYKLQGLVFEHIGYLNSVQGVYDFSIDNYQKSIHYYELAGDSIGMVFGCRNIARGYLAKQHNDSARWYVNKGLALLPDTTNQIRVSLLQLLGLIAKEEKQYSQAIDHIVAAIKLNKNVKNESRYYLSLGRIYMDIGEFALAEECFMHCICTNDIIISSGAYSYLCLLKKEERDYQQALCYKEKSDSILNIVSNDKLRSQLLTLQKKYETDKLVMENRQVRLEKANQTYFYSFLVLLVIGLSIYFIKLYRKKNLRNIEALKRNEKIIEGVYLQDYRVRTVGKAGA